MGETTNPAEANNQVGASPTAEKTATAAVSARQWYIPLPVGLAKQNLLAGLNSMPGVRYAALGNMISAAHGSDWTVRVVPLLTVPVWNQKMVSLTMLPAKDGMTFVAAKSEPTSSQLWDWVSEMIDKLACAKWYLNLGGSDNDGPFSFNEVRSMVKAGKINQTTLVWPPNATAWCTAGSIPRLFSDGRVGGQLSGPTDPKLDFMHQLLAVPYQAQDGRVYEAEAIFNDITVTFDQVFTPQGSWSMPLVRWHWEWRENKILIQATGPDSVTHTTNIITADGLQMNEIKMKLQYVADLKRFRLASENGQ